MSTRVWLSSGGYVALNHLTQVAGQYANLTIKTHHATGKKYIKLTGNLADPAEEVPEILEQYVEQVTFKGTVRLLGGLGLRLKTGLYLSSDMRTSLVVTNVSMLDKVSRSTTLASCEVFARGPSVVAVRELLYRLSFSTARDANYNGSLISHHELFLVDQEYKKGSFAPILLPFEH